MRSHPGCGSELSELSLCTSSTHREVLIIHIKLLWTSRTEESAPVGLNFYSAERIFRKVGANLYRGGSGHSGRNLWECGSICNTGVCGWQSVCMWQALGHCCPQADPWVSNRVSSTGPDQSIDWLEFYFPTWGQRWQKQSEVAIVCYSSLRNSEESRGHRVKKNTELPGEMCFREEKNLQYLFFLLHHDVSVSCLLVASDGWGPVAVASLTLVLVALLCRRWWTQYQLHFDKAAELTVTHVHSTFPNLTPQGIFHCWFWSFVLWYIIHRAETATLPTTSLSFPVAIINTAEGTVKGVCL